MAQKLNETVNDILGIETKPETNDMEQMEIQALSEMSPPAKVDDKPHVDQDYDTSRDNYYQLIEKGQQAIDGILDIAKEGQHPRAYEVAGQLIGQVAQTVDKLQDLQKKLKDLKEVPNKTSANIKNALFVGSTAELQKMLNRKKEDEVIEGETNKPKENNTGDK